MKQILFFGLRDDLFALLEEVESHAPLKYARMGNFRRDEFKDGSCVYDRSSELPDLGTASADSSAACAAYLVCDREAPITLRHLEGANGERVCVDQVANPDSVEFRPGGVWKEDVVLHGRIATASVSQTSQSLMKRFESATQRHFSKIKAFYVGPKALSLLQSGKRLTISAQSPRQFDLDVETGTF